MLTVLLQAPLFNTAEFGAFPIGSMNDFVLLAVKTLLILGALLYLVFAFVITRQIQVMRNTVVTPFSTTVGFVGFVHLLLALGVLILFITIL